MAKENNQNVEEESLEDSSLIQPSTPSEPEPDLDNNTPESNNNPDNSSGDSPPPPKKNLLGRLSFFVNVYFIIFIILLLIAGGVVYLSLKTNKPTTPQSSTAQSLTDKQLADLKGNTTLVGDSQQTLDIQGNSIFEGPVLMRNNLDVAGSIKVGGSLSLPAITVGGSSTFGQIQVSQTLLVGGNTTLNGQLTVQKDLTVAGVASFGSLSASQLTVSSLQLKGDLVVSRHLSSSGGVPSSSYGSAVGGGGTASINGTDTAGTVTINTGGSPPAGCFVNISFTQRFNAIPHVIISPSNSSAATIQYYTNRSNTSFSICSANAPSAGATYIFDYMVMD